MNESNIPKGARRGRIESEMLEAAFGGAAGLAAGAAAGPVGAIVGSAIGLAIGGLAARAMDSELHEKREARDTIDEIGTQAAELIVAPTPEGGEIPVLRALREDHAILRDLLDALALFAATTVDATPAAKDHLEKTSSLLMRYLQTVHLEEERLVFRSALGGDVGSVSRLAREHDELYALLATLRASCRLSGWDQEDLRVLRETTHRLVETMSDHVAREEGLEFPATERRHAAGLAPDLEMAIASFESRLGPMSTRAHLRAEASTLLTD